MNDMPALPRVLLVDDDPLVRRWVEAALDGMALQLVCCASVDEARAALAHAPAALILCDLMLPGTPGLAWLQELAADESTRGQARLVAFSAGIDAQVRAELQVLGVWRMLHKPVPLVALLACVDDALALHSVPCAAAAAATDLRSPAETAAVRRHFGGDAALFNAYRDTCLAQFEDDVVVGDAACAAGDLAVLRRLGHSLKSVLAMLGLDGPSRLAQLLDDAALRGDAAGAAIAWQRLREALETLPRPA